MVGSVAVTHKGSEVDVVFEPAPGFTLQDTRTYVGKSWVPGNEYPLVHSDLSAVRSDRVSASVTENQPVVVVAQATVCGVFPSTPSGSNTHASVRGGSVSSHDSQENWGSMLSTSIGKLW